MKYENGNWIMCGTAFDDPNRIRTIEQLFEYVNKFGFLPLFQNEIKGFSLEEHTAAECWFTENPDNDPWEWRAIAARSGKVAYGKFFGKKAGFVSLECLPCFANFRRNGYDFDSLYEEGIAKRREKLIMDLFENNSELFSFEMKNRGGFGKNGEKNFNGIVTDLQMQTYLTIKDFRRRTNKKGAEYGMCVAVYTTPEAMWGYDFVTSAYCEEPEQSEQKILTAIKTLYPTADDKHIRKLFLK